MPATLTFALALMGLACLMSALAPAWVLLRPQRQVPDTVGAARVGLFGTALIVIVPLSWFAGISFSVGPANVLLVLAALIAGLLLSVMAFFCRPSFLGGTVGLIGGAAWLLMLGLAIMIGPSFSSDPALSLGDGNYCRASPYGFLITESGTQIELFRRLAFVEYSTGKHNYPEDPEPADAQYANKALFQQCLEKHRRTPGS